MSQPPARSIWKIVLTNFINSLRPRQIRGNLVGSDYFGNKYYEIPADPSVGKRKASRWFDPPKKDDFMQEMPAEWEAWLRGRRTEPPSEEEVMRNYALMQMKKKNAIAVDAKSGQMTPMEKGMETFPKRPEYEMSPGAKSDKE
ncbi:NADH dehydrogenase [ubiquinone] 1 alpha subcomplex assembly factor 2 [Zophobas morio]|uniref:NADH dehydrogenase [ubiquinone] 1 alpha subcomplex assembly factor 2 n=1 Tax=Zophobas morio TaxID=2755281 RepID=UPI003082DE87